MPSFGNRWLIRVWNGRAALDEPRQLSPVLLKAMVFAMWFGLCTTTYTLFVHGHDYQWQVLASVVKVPLLFFTALLVSFVPLYLMSRLLGLGLRAIVLWRLAGASVAVMALALAPSGLLIAVCCMTRNYSIVILTCYVVFMIAGLAGVLFFLVSLHRCASLPTAAGSSEAPTRSRRGWKANALGLGWAVCFALVAAEVGWDIRPIVGWTGVPFSWFRHDDARMYEQVYYELVNMTHDGGARFPEANKPDRAHD
jgi:hypothetical protein